MIAAPARSALIRQKLQHVRGHRFGGRAARFRSLRQGASSEGIAEPDFACVAALPDWVLADNERQRLVGVAAAILYKRDAIERELSGGRLAAIAALVGDDLFERLCDHPLPEDAGVAETVRLPRPEDFVAIGEELRRAALPDPLRETEPTVVDAAKARTYCGIAARIVETADID